MLVAVVLAVIAALALILYLLPGNTLLSAFGTFSNSALQRGLFPIIAVLLYLLSLIYAFAIGRFNDMEDVVKATVNITVRIPGYFITLFVASQLIAVILYSFFIDYNLSLPMPTPVKLLAAVLYGIPLILHLLSLKQKQ